MRYLVKSRPGYFPMREMERMLGAFNDFDLTPTHRVSPMKVDILEEEDAYIIQAEMPGHNKDDVNISVENNVLTIEVKSVDEDEKQYIRRERCNMELKRTFRLDNSFDTEKIGAEMENGVLIVKIPKAAKLQPKQIAIN